MYALIKAWETEKKIETQKCINLTEKHVCQKAEDYQTWKLHIYYIMTDLLLYIISFFSLFWEE